MAIQSDSQLLTSDATQPIAKSKWVRSLIGVLLLALVSGSGYVLYRQRVILPEQAAKRQTQTVTIERVTLPVTVSANGTIQPERSINLSPPTAGVLQRLLVQEGERVQQGQILAYMDDANLQGELLQAQGQLAAAEANLQKVRAGNRPEEIAQAQARLRTAQANLQQAEDDWRRNQELVKVGAISQQAFQKTVTARDSAQAQVEEAEQALALLQAGSRQEEIAAARAEVMQAQGAVQTIEAQIKDTVIRAPFSGIVSRKYADPGAFVTPTTAASSALSATSSSILSLTTQNQVIAYVAESDIAQIRQGQTVTLRADAYPNQTFNGRVIQLSTQSIVQQNVTSFEVKVAIDPDARLRAGMNVQVDFNVGQLTQVLAIPSVAIVRRENATGVFVLNAANQAIFTPIETGITVAHRTQVKSGLTGTERIMIGLPADQSLPALGPTSPLNPS